MSWNIASNDLADLGIKLPKNTGVLFRLSDFAQIGIDYDAQFQRLFLTFPSEFLPLQQLRNERPIKRSTQLQRDAGAFVNYNLLASSGSGRNRYLNVWHEGYLFNEDVHLVSMGMYQQALGQAQDSGYTRFETYAQWDNEDALWRLAIGDVINAAPAWGRSIRMGGIRFARDFALDPSLITFPLPEFYGESAVPSQVDLLLNGKSYRREQVDPGPFLVSAIPYFSGAGTADIITTDAQGRQLSQRVDFYVTNQLLAKRQLDYDLTFGFRRNNFGLDSYDYDNRPVFSGSLRYGLHDYVTPQLHLQSGEGLLLVGVGANLLMGNIGVLELAHSVSDHHDIRGKQTLVGYSYAQRWLGVSMRYTHRHQGYRDLGVLDQGVLNDQQWQVGLSFYEPSLGALGINYFHIRDPHMDARSFMSLTWNRYFDRGFTAYFSYTNQLYGQREKVFSFSLSFPFGNYSQASVSGYRNPTREWSNQVQAMRNVPYEGGMGWRVGIDDGNRNNAYGSWDYRAAYYDTSMGFYRLMGEVQYQAELAGAIVLMNRDIYWGRAITDAFALVEAGQPGVPVLVGNKKVGVTNEDGKLLVADLYSYHENRLSIDPMDLPVNAALSSVEQIVMPRRKSGVNLQFSVRYTRPVLLVVQDERLQLLPVGTVLRVKDTQDTYQVGWNGEVYIENLVAPVELVFTENNCSLQVVPPVEDIPFPRLGPLTCLSSAEGHSLP
ncbi:fimbria/pilus outer membrane usher protein [Cellvibrio japonicus]|nr:fimbria/pilus outer membrane usher protein [Cellvibrio japonicus]QEI11874.1 fimbrial biogenesis outer membrane usher protein [Cellvibrio japonicus]QEI15448.1 fimbrial biogenesis outer membrane usher protein [Cellvibrio japonicus]QEI19027.1 fimbrial biogenesis outer membrane usher protein [Cellvibrio japonicus]